MTDSTDDIHVIPENQGHQETSGCWCEPKIEYIDNETQVSVWVHNSINPDEVH